MVYAALSKRWRKRGKKLVNAPGKSAMTAATYSGNVKVSSQDLGRPGGSFQELLVGSHWRTSFVP
jgi:hypothetical protein